MNSKTDITRTLLQWALALWALALVLYFEIREGLIRWPWLFKPEEGGFFEANGIPDPRLNKPPVADSDVAPYVEILRNLFLPWNIQWDNAPWAALLISAGMIVSYTVLGWMFLTLFRIFVPLGAKVCLALTLGMGVVGIAAEGLGLANLLNQKWTMVMWGVLLLLGLAAWLQQFLNRHIPRMISMDTQLSSSEQETGAREWYRLAYPWPTSPVSLVTFWVFVVLFGLITLFVTLHAVGEPVVYWDSLILYVGYARDIYRQGGFPEKVVGQVGVGLGANYPHLYELLTAQTAAVAGFWNDAFAQLLPPVATTAALVLVYYTALEITRDRLVSISAALIVRAVPYGLSYSQFASNYSVAILITAAFIYVAVRLVRDGLAGYRHLMLIFAAIGVHINYLMWILWPVAMVAILLAHWRYRPLDHHNLDWQESAPGTPLPVYPPDFMSEQYRPTVFQLLRRREFWGVMILAFALAAPWYVRNTIVTGNPVYAFYANIFPSKNVNPDVMKSAEREWALNGDGLGNVGQTLGEKLRGSWLYFVTGNQHWKLSPFLMAFVMPGFVIWALWWLGRTLRRPGRRDITRIDPVIFRCVAVVAVLFLLLWFYAYVIADFYLYQIITVLPLFGVFAAMLFLFCTNRSVRVVLYSLVLLTAIAPGLVMAIMGFKLKKTGVYEGMPAPQFAVTALRSLFMNPDVYYHMEYGGDMEMFSHVNMLPPGTKILTHENRHLLLNPELNIIHLDDWEVQAGYGKSVAERMRILDEIGIDYYLYVPNEDRHVANSWLGMEDLISAGYFEQEYDTASVDSSQPDIAHNLIPRDRNVLYKRTAR